MRWWLTLVARRKSEELFMLNLLLVTLGLAWLTEHAGLSLALGAFVAGMLVAETEYKHQVETDIRPFHDVLLGLFFITIGMKLDWRPVLDQWVLVLLLTCGPVLAKFAGRRAGAAVPRRARHRAAHRPVPGAGRRVRLRAADAGRRRGLVAPQWMSPVLASMVLSMLATPFIVMYSEPHRDAPVGQRLAAAVGAADDHRQEGDPHRETRDHLRLRPQRPEPGAHAGDTQASPTWRWTSTPTACARPPPPARAWSSATPRGCRA
jgi:Kef-type K+ transport system membrane component KefB